MTIGEETYSSWSLLHNTITGGDLAVVANNKLGASLSAQCKDLSRALSAVLDTTHLFQSGFMRSFSVLIP